ncbi:unnamed protein product [Linum trigynum]|uniref:Uncharacterized protein n=1 Tax=Linum trigynum TaxID=586398 RepID=A0AAV2DW15_9ROSI
MRGALPSKTIVNPKDQNFECNAILSRSGKVTLDVIAKETIEEEKAPPKVDEQELSEGEGEEAKKASPTPPLVAEYKPPLPFPYKGAKRTFGGGMRHINGDAQEASNHNPDLRGNGVHATVCHVSQGASCKEEQA